jgi:hypothetical protein
MLSPIKPTSMKRSPNHFLRASLLYLVLLGIVALLAPAPGSAQNSAQGSAQESAPAPAQPPASADSSSKQKSTASASRHSDDFLIRGTIFTEEGLALPGAQMRIRRTAEKKPRWQTVSNSRGDFAVRVKMGTAYEVTVRAKGFQEQSLPVNAATGDRFKDLVFRLQREGGKKT